MVSIFYVIAMIQEAVFLVSGVIGTRPQKFELVGLMVDFWRNSPGAWSGINRTHPNPCH